MAEESLKDLAGASGSVVEKKASHTPGPWNVGSTINARYITGIGEVFLIRREEADDNRYVAFASLDAMGFDSPIKTTQQEQEANARLIAAAPELLSALRDLSTWANSCVELLEHAGYRTTASGLVARLKDANAAIHSATGE